MQLKDISELTIQDNFIFSAVMRDPEKCKTLLETILNIKIDHIEYPEYEKNINLSLNAKGIRLDLYVEGDSKTVYNIELQTTSHSNLPKRSRYYHGMIDLNILEKGEDYNKLKRSYVIFICPFDPFEEEQYLYTFVRRCEEVPNLTLNDETVTIFINTTGKYGNVSEEFKELADYINGNNPSGEYTREIDKAVNDIKNDKKWRRDYMTLQMMLNEAKEDAYNKGVESGIEQGIERGIEQEKERNEIVQAQYLLTSVKNIIDAMSCSLERALEIIGETMEDYEKAQRTVQR